MNNKQFKDFVGSKIFGVDFVKADGSLRTYKAKVDVNKYTKGGSNPVEHKPHLVTIFEMNSKQYRTLNLNTVKGLRCGDLVFPMEQ